MRRSAGPVTRPHDLFYEVVFTDADTLHEINVMLDQDGDGVYDQRQSIAR
jgi:hypothetical protein